MRGQRTPPEAGRITERQRDALLLLAAGYTAPEIAKQLRVSHQVALRMIADMRAAAGARTNESLIYLAAVDGLFGDVFGTRCARCGSPT